MNDQEKMSFTPIRLRRYIAILVVCWTVAIVVTLAWELTDEQNQAVDVARSEARGVWKEEAAIRRWDAANGGIYVPVTENTHPDPYLVDIPERDVLSPSGRKLTLVNPAAIMRQIHETAQEEFGAKGHMTSLRPVSPRNAPDSWEKAALESFEQGADEVCAVEDMDGQRYLRLIRPMLVDASCLKCHAEQGYKVGDIRGGLSVAVPLASLWPSELEQITHRIIGYGGMWIFGLGGIALLSRNLRRQVEHRYLAEQQLREAHAMLEQRVAQRTADLAESNRHLQSEIVERKQAERWLLESEQRFRGFFEQGLVGMAILSADRQCVEVNARLCKMLGYIEEDLIGKTWMDLTHPEDRPVEEIHFHRLLGGVVKGFIMDKRCICRDGKVLDVGLSVQCMWKEDGSVDCILVLLRPRTDRT